MRKLGLASKAARASTSRRASFKWPPRLLHANTGSEGRSARLFFPRRSCSISRRRQASMCKRVNRRVETRRAAIDEAINSFNTAIGGVLTSIKEASGSLSGASAAMQQTASSATGLLKSASELSAQTSDSVETAVTAADSMAESIKEIRQQTAYGLEMARSAANDTAKTNSTIRALDQATQEIGTIVELISKIASQTNLLAPNTNIEAGRPGGMA